MENHEQIITEASPPQVLLINTRGVLCGLNTCCEFERTEGSKEGYKLEWECPQCDLYLCGDCMFGEKCKNGMSLCPVCPADKTCDMIQRASPSPPTILKEEEFPSLITTTTKRKARRTASKTDVKEVN